MPFNNTNILPISVIIPTLNCRGKISAHLDGCKEWLPYVQEVIVVDSCSSDGTYEILKTFLASYECKIIQTGPGLYKSWNHGVTLASQKYVYFSTIGESITLEGLKKLTEWCENLNLDVIITKPIFRFEAHNSEQNQIFWPIHSLAKTLLKYGEVFCPDPTLLKFLGAIFIPESILGSSASNLYRSKVLQNNPFLENIGSQGDVVWAMNNLPSLRVGISGLSFSTFFWDGDRKSSSEEQSLIAAKILNEFSESNVSDLIKDSLFHLRARINIRNDQLDKWSVQLNEWNQQLIQWSKSLDQREKKQSSTLHKIMKYFFR